MDKAQLTAARHTLSERTIDGKPLSSADLAHKVEEEFDQSGLGDLVEKMTMQEIIESLVGKRVVAVEWRPAYIHPFAKLLNLESLTLEGGTVLRFEAMEISSGNIVHVEVEESKDAKHSR